MKDYLGTLGYAFVEIRPKLERHAENKNIDLTYKILEGPRVYVNRINIEGNVRTLDEVIRREFRVNEGDPFDAAKIRRSQQRIQNLDYFSKVDVKKRRVPDAPDKVDIDVNVEEKSTGELTLGAGFSTADGPIFDSSVTERNLLGTGQYLRLGLTLAGQRQEGTFSYTEPYLFDREIAAGFDLFRRTRDRQSESSFDSETSGVTLRATYALSEHLSHHVRYSLRSDDITNIDPLASRFIKDQEGQTTTSLFGHSLIYDDRDSAVSPTEGFYVRYNQDIAGLGGDAKHMLNEIRSIYYMPVYESDVVLSLAGKGGYIFGLGKDGVLINNRFFVGSDDIRGFRSDGIGPRDRNTKDALGGNIYYAGTAELTFPLGLPEELGVSGAVFTDVASLWTVDDSGTDIEDDSTPRMSVGAGIAWNSPFGPIRIDVAAPLQKNQYDETEVIRFSFGTRF